MKKNYVLIALMLCFFWYVLPAEAVTVTVADNLADNMLIGQGQSVSGQFDINPALAGNSDYNLPYNVTSATTTFKFSDDTDPLVNTNSYALSSTSSWIKYDSNEYYRYYTRNTYNYYQDAYEQVQVAVGTQVSMDGTNWYDAVTVSTVKSSSTTTTRQSYTFPCGPFGWATCVGYYTVYWTTYSTYNYIDDTSGYKGDLTITTEFDAGNLEDLSLDGIVDFTISGESGDIIFKEGTLTADVEPNPVSNTVPEPATLLLLGLGLAGTACLIRKRMK